MCIYIRNIYIYVMSSVYTWLEISKFGHSSMWLRFLQPPESRWTINRVTSHGRISPRIPSQNVSQNICSLMFVYGKSWDFYGTYLCLSPTTMVSGVLRQASFFGSTWPPLMHSTLSAQLRTANFKGVAKGEIMDACIQTDRQTHRWTDVHTYMYS